MFSKLERRGQTQGQKVEGVSLDHVVRSETLDHEALPNKRALETLNQNST
ncbi:MAG: hypothetical protein ACR2PF_08040 [Rhizobiaceae bacterium]